MSIPFVPLSNGYIGPFLRFHNTDLATNTWQGSLLIIADRNIPPPSVVLSISPNPLQFTVIDQFQDSVFIRFDLIIPQLPQTQPITYFINGTNSYNFNVPGIDVPWRILFYSCNGFSADVDQAKAGGFDGLWSHALVQHTQNPYHVQLGGGDQLYCDPVFDIAPLKNWLSIGDRKTRHAQPWTPELETSVENFFFSHYLAHWQRGSFAAALASIPHIFSVDDHDVFDGYGSYPPKLQLCPVFQGVAKVAFRFYLSFQHHTNWQLARQEGYFGEGYNLIKMLGKRIAVVSPDTRFERTKDQVVGDRSWNEIKERMELIPRTCQHVLLLLAVPIVYPRMSGTESTMQIMSKAYHSKALGGVISIFQKSGAMKTIVNKFGEPELLDDLVDHWTAENHAQERLMLVQFLQDFAKRHLTRVSFLSGDVHVGGYGHFRSTEQVPPANDYRLMTQIISSAIVNAPPPDMVTTILHRNNKPLPLDLWTTEEMIERFSHDVDGKFLEKKKLMRRRNFCSLDDCGWLKVALWVEKGAENGGGVVEYGLSVPVLESI